MEWVVLAATGAAIAGLFAVGEGVLPFGLDNLPIPLAAATLGQSLLGL